MKKDRLIKKGKPARGRLEEPISLHPLRLEEVVEALVNTPSPKKKK
ncbi:MAG: hypothetical protein QME66_05930 [Candidatus Eisenbacteria bacterium]|nr:hypothetical protein [Candidatus Eisenbacteria bacterium]